MIFWCVHGITLSLSLKYCKNIVILDRFVLNILFFIEIDKNKKGDKEKIRILHEMYM